MTRQVIPSEWNLPGIWAFFPSKSTEKVIPFLFPVAQYVQILGGKYTMENKYFSVMLGYSINGGLA